MHTIVFGSSVDLCVCVCVGGCVFVHESVHLFLFLAAHMCNCFLLEDSCHGDGAKRSVCVSPE